MGNGNNKPPVRYIELHLDTPLGAENAQFELDELVAVLQGWANYLEGYDGENLIAEGYVLGRHDLDEFDKGDLLNKLNEVWLLVHDEHRVKAGDVFVATNRSSWSVTFCLND